MNKKRIFLITLLVLCIGVIFTYNDIRVKADSGFDSSYSGGGGYSSGGGGYSGGSYSGGGYSGGSYSSGGYSGGSYSSGGSSGSISGFGVAAIIMFIFIGAFIYAVYYNAFKKSTLIPNLECKKAKLDELKKVLPNFNVEKFIMQSFNIYKNIQNAWMKFDYKELRKYTTDEMYNMYESQLETLKVKGEKNIMSDYKLNMFRIENVDISKDNIAITAYMQISLYDYIVDKDNKVLKGSNMKKITINYEMTFVRTIDEKENVCPNCHAPLSSNASTKCEYCDSIITPKSHDFVLSKKINKGQF